MTLQEELTQITCDLVRFASTADNSDQIAAAMDYVQAYLQAIPNIYIHQSTCNNKPALVATLHDTRSPALFLNGHIDVIPASSDQFEPHVRNNRIYGRATQDMKGGVAVLLRLLKELAAQDPRPDVGIQIVSDEETGGDFGTGRLLAEGWNCGFFIAVEPTDLRICYEQKGILWIEIRIEGKSTHGSRPWDGLNPLITLGNGLHRIIQTYPVPSSHEWRTTVTPTFVQGTSSSINQTPTLAIARLDVRYVPSDSPDDVIETIYAGFAGGRLSTLKRAGPLMTDPDVPVVQGLARAVEHVLGKPATLYREHFGSDARFYSMVNIPAVCFGPTGSGMHSTDEWVDIESLAQVYQTLYTYAMETIL